MSGHWRAWATTASGLLMVVGVVLWVATGNFMLMAVGAVALVTSMVERGYGSPRSRPAPDMRPTDERFVDPESGKLVTVWLDPATGERRYVAEAEHAD